MGGCENKSFSTFYAFCSYAFCIFAFWFFALYSFFEFYLKLIINKNNPDAAAEEIN